jgi:hypothetical protein
MGNITHAKHAPYKKGKRAALLYVDMFTGCIKVCPIPNKSADTLIKAINTTIAQSFGIPNFYNQTRKQA